MAARKKTARIRGIMNQNQRKQLEALEQEATGVPRKQAARKAAARKPTSSGNRLRDWLGW